LDSTISHPKRENVSSGKILHTLFSTVTLHPEKVSKGKNLTYRHPSKVLLPPE
jgi:hypothetical protein